MEIRKIVKIIFIFCVLIGISQNRELLAQCSTVPVVEAVFNGDFELGWLRNNGSTYANGEGRGFQSDLNYVGDYNGQPTQCWNNIQDGFAVGRTDILHPNCDNQPNNPYAASSYLGFGTQFKDHTPGLNGEGYALIADFYTCNASSTSKLYTGGKPIAWLQKVNIFPGQNYYFSAWFANYTSNPSTAVLNFVVIPLDASDNPILAQRQVVGTATPTGTMQWQQFYGQWTNPGTYTRVQLSIEVDVSQTSCSSGGDFAFDDYFIYKWLSEPYFIESSNISF